MGRISGQAERGKERVKRHALNFVVILALCGCATTATYDEHAYALQTSVLADILKLLDVANTPYDNNLDQIKAVTLNVERAYQYDRSRPLNRTTIAQWDLIRDPNRNTFAGFLKLWKAKGTVSVVYITEKKRQITQAFDQITQLEAAKIKSK
jgi:hypothetical protein